MSWLVGCVCVCVCVCVSPKLLVLYMLCRSITLVGEKERKLLKDVVKSAKCPVKSRVISSGAYEYQVPMDISY